MIQHSRPDPLVIGGLGGSVGQRIFQRFKKSGGYGFISNINIRGPNAYASAGDYGNWGAAAGGAAGTYGGNQYANQ